MSPAVFSHGSLRLYLLSILDTEPMHGYELIQALSERFGGTYSPSAGTIYPRLAKLEEEGLVTKDTQGRKTVYAITDAGRAEVRSRASELDDIESEVTDSVRRLADEVRTGVETAMRSLRAELAAAARQSHADARPAPEPEPAADPERAARASSRSALHEADALLTEFRQQLRSDLRLHAARATVTDDVVAHLRSALSEVRAGILRLLG